MELFFYECLDLFWAWQTSSCIYLNHKEKAEMKLSLFSPFSGSWSKSYNHEPGKTPFPMFLLDPWSVAWTARTDKVFAQEKNYFVVSQAC